MNQSIRDAITMSVGASTVTAAASGLFMNFVKSGLRIPLLIAGLVLVAMGGYGVFRDVRADDDHGHSHQSRVGYLMIIPFILLGVAAPPPLGAYSAAKDPGILSSPAQGYEMPPIDGPADQPATMSLSEFSARALYDDTKSLTGRRVRLTGFVAPADNQSGWALSRIVLSCCAADGYAIKVELLGAERLPDDTWIQVEGTWSERPHATKGAPIAMAALTDVEVRPVERPKNPYD